MIVKLGMLIVFFGVMVGIGLYCRRHAPQLRHHAGVLRQALRQ